MKLKFIPLLAFAIVNSCAHAQSTDSLTLNNRQHVLNGRVSFSFPKATKNYTLSNRQNSINTDRETNLVLDFGKQRVIFRIQEMFKLANGSLYLQLRKTDDKLQPICKPMPNRYSLTAIVATPINYDPGNSRLINSLWVVMPDSTIFKFDVNAIAKNDHDRGKLILLTDRIFNSMKITGKKISRTPHTETVNVYDDQLSFDLPKDYLLGVKDGIDSKTVSIDKFTSVLDTTKFELQIYFGSYPFRAHDFYGFSLKSAKIERGQALGQPTNWLIFKDAARHLFVKEQQLPSNLDSLIMDSDNFFIRHMVMVAGSEQAIKELSGFAQSIRIKGRKKK